MRPRISITHLKRKEGRMEEKKEGRKDGKKEGRKEGRKEGTKEGRKERRKEVRSVTRNFLSAIFKGFSSYLHLFIYIYIMYLKRTRLIVPVWRVVKIFSFLNLSLVGRSVGW